MPFEPKYITSLPPITVDERHVKQYQVSNSETPIAAEITAAAHAFIPRLLPNWDATTPPASWSVLHQARDGAAYLNVYSWVWDNVVEFHAAVAGQPFLGCPDTDPTNFTVLDRPWIGCIWELPPFGHERSAWVRHMLDTDRPDLASYLADAMADGPAGPAN